MTLKVAIVEDEVNILKMMELYIEKIPKYELVAAFSNPLEALEVIPSLQLDVVLIDIEMPELNGLQLAKRIKHDKLQVVFTTAYSQYAVDAFRVKATDYLLKPITHKMLLSLSERLELIKSWLNQTEVEEHEPAPSIQCFGSFSTRNHEGEIVKWPTRKTEELFAYFITHQDTIINKWIIADLLWPELDHVRAIHNVHNTVYRLKKTLRDYLLPLTIDTLNQGYILFINHPMQVDLYDFKRLLNQPYLSPEEMNAFQNLYTGPLFNDKDYIWSIGLREKLEQSYAEIVPDSLSLR